MLKLLKKVFPYVLIFSWIYLLKNTDAVYSAYLLVGVCSLFAVYANSKNSYRGTKVTGLLAALFYAIVVLANYKLFSSLGAYERSAALFALPIGGFLCFYHLLVFGRTFSQRFTWRRTKYKMPPKKFYLLCFAVLSVVYVLTLTICSRPAVTTADSVWQLQMIDSGAITDHHPFYHTMFIKLIYGTIFSLTRNRSFAVYCYVFVQALIMAAIFAYAVMTLFQLKINKKMIGFVFAIFALLPCHLVFSFTIWKDVLFGGCALLFTVACYRLLNNIGNNKVVDYVLLAIGALAICLLRNNGFYVFVLAVLIFAFIYKKSQLRMLIVLGSILVASFGLKLLIPAFGVKASPAVESYSIPIQQIARVVVDDGNISSDEKESIERMLPLDTIKKEYRNYISDPLKVPLWASDKEEYLTEHKMDYLALWVNLGIKNPKAYVKAWVDQTRGYWGGGYKYWNVVLENNVEPERNYDKDLAHKALKTYIDIFNDCGVLRLFLSIGLFVWFMIAALYFAAAKGDKSLAFLTIVPLGVIATLLIATPVYSEFRYAYSLFCCAPFVLPLLFNGGQVKCSKK